MRRRRAISPQRTRNRSQRSGSFFGSTPLNQPRTWCTSHSLYLPVTVRRRPTSGEVLRAKLKKIALVLLALIPAASLYAQTADSSSADKPRPLPPQVPAQVKQSFWNRLELTEDQKDKLKQIREADRDALSAAWAQVKIAQESLRAALLANPEDSADIQAKATNLADALRTKSVQWALHQARVAQVLTPVQRVTLYEAIRNHTKGWHRHGGWSESGQWPAEHRPEKWNQAQPPAAPEPSASPAPESPTN